MKSNIIALVFLFVGGGFVVTLLKSFMGLLSLEPGKNQSQSSAILKLFTWPIVLAVVLIVFCVFVLPNIS